MLTIGVLTFHNHENRGAILQSYALCQVLEEYFDCSAEVIEYRTKSRERTRKMSIIDPRQPLQIMRRYKDRRIVEDFFINKLPTSDDSITTNDHKKAVDWLKRKNYDALVTGSDEIWKVRKNTKAELRSLISPPRPFPNLYFLDPVIKSTKISYAASANKTSLDKLNNKKQQLFEDHIDSYDFISVRDRHTKEIVSEITDKDVFQVPDPTIMVDLPTKNVMEKLKKIGVDFNNPILCFHGSDCLLFREICDHYRNRGYQIVTTRSSRLADIELEGKIDPFEYYACYKHFDMVVTNSLHSTIFSLKTRTPFVTIDTQDVYKCMESKTHSLLQDFHMTDRHFNGMEGDLTQFYEHQSQIEQKPNSAHINERIKYLQDQGEEFLNKVSIE